MYDGGFWIVGLLIFAIAVFSTRSFMPFIPIFLLLFVILPAGRRAREEAGQDFEKRKRDFEKPKRYVERDDGTLLEVIDEQPNDDTHYV